MVRGRFAFLIAAFLVMPQFAEAQQKSPKDQQKSPNEVSRRLGILAAYLKKDAEEASELSKLIADSSASQFKLVLDAQASQSPSTLTLQVIKGFDGPPIDPIPAGLKRKSNVVFNLASESSRATEFAEELEKLQKEIAFLPEQAALDKLQSIIIPPGLLVVFDKVGDHRLSQQPGRSLAALPTDKRQPAVPITTYIYFDPRDGGFTTDYPAVGAILYHNADQVMQAGCTGTLIAPNIVITAAHCNFHPNGEPRHPKAVYFQHAGVFELAQPPIVHDEVPRAPTGHADLSRLPDADLALLVLATPVTGIKPAKINDEQSVRSGVEGRIVGYGGRRYYSHQSGPEAATPLAAMGLKVRARVKTSQCAGFPHLQRSICWQFESRSGFGTTCRGDSGGPLFVRVPGGDDVLFGITSGSLDNPCAVLSQAYDVDVGKFAPWIKEKLRGFAVTGPEGGLATLEPATNATSWFILPPDYQYMPLTGDRLVVTETIDLPRNLETLRVGVNATIRGIRIAIEAAPANGPPQPLTCQPGAPGHVAFCEVRAPVAGKWIMKFRGDVNEEFQAVATVFRRSN